MNALTDWLSLRMRDIDRYRVLKNVVDHHLTQRDGAAQLDLSPRQVRRLCQRVQAEGPQGLVHRLRGRSSNHRLPPTRLAHALTLLRAPRYAGFGPTLAQEKLQQLHGVTLSVSTLRCGMIQAALWTPRRHQPSHRAWRERRACVGELIQLDGSEHAWFEGRGPRCVFVEYIDDATSRILYAEFVEHEDTVTLLRTTRSYLQRYGRPLAFYVDKDSIYKISRQATLEEALRDGQPLTQFARAMEELNVQVVFAHSPQAKGRVERSFGTHQDRLVKELRLANVSTPAQGNHFLWTTYLPAHNAKFAVPPANTTDAHRPLLRTHRLEAILSLRTARTLAHDDTLRFQHQSFQVLPEQPVRIRPKDTILVETRLDGSTHLRVRDQYLRFSRLPHRPYRPLARPRPVPAPLGPRPHGPWKPAADHPWRRFPACQTNAALRAHAALTGVLDMAAPAILAHIEASCVQNMPCRRDRAQTPATALEHRPTGGPARSLPNVRRPQSPRPTRGATTNGRTSTTTPRGGTFLKNAEGDISIYLQHRKYPA